MIKRIGVLVVLVAILLGQAGPTGTANAEFLEGGFTDISGHWAEATIVKLGKAGILDGYPDGTFRANESVSADQFVKILLLSFTQKFPNGDRTWTDSFKKSLSPANLSILNQDYRDFDFKPSTVGYWAKPYIDLASDLNFISKTQFPDFKAKLTREKVAEIVYYTMKETEYLEDEAYGRQLVEKVGDIQSATSREQKFIAEAYAKGIMEGYPNGYFGVGVTVTRAEALTILERIVDKSKRIALTANPADRFSTVIPTKDGGYKKIMFPSETMLNAYSVMLEAGKLRGTNYDMEETTLRLYQNADAKANALSRNPDPALPMDEASLWLEPEYNTYGITVSMQEGAWARNQEVIRAFARYLFGYDSLKFEDTIGGTYAKVAQKAVVENYALGIGSYTVEVEILDQGKTIVVSIVPKK